VALGGALGIRRDAGGSGRAPRSEGQEELAERVQQQLLGLVPGGRSRNDAGQLHQGGLSPAPVDFLEDGGQLEQLLHGTFKE
jgi:hypothetical protein